MKNPLAHAALLALFGLACLSQTQCTVSPSQAISAGYPTAPKPGLKRYVISDFGAVGDGITVNTKTIQGVIDDCAAKGGGVLVIPQGTFWSGALFF